VVFAVLAAAFGSCEDIIDYPSPLRLCPHETYRFNTAEVLPLTQASVHFRNKATHPVKVFWMQQETFEVEVNLIEPGKDWSTGTYTGHAFRVRHASAGYLLREYVTARVYKNTIDPNLVTVSDCVGHDAAPEHKPIPHSAISPGKWSGCRQCVADLMRFASRGFSG
jgi:hypothetical protein